MSDAFIGRGWSFPLGVSPSGGAAMVDSDEEIRQAIRLILGTEPGERPMRPEFGCAIHHHVFGPVDASSLGAIAHEVRHALDRWEPRITVDDVEATKTPRPPRRCGSTSPTTTPTPTAVATSSTPST